MIININSEYVVLKDYLCKGRFGDFFLFKKGEIVLITIESLFEWCIPPYEDFDKLFIEFSKYRDDRINDILDD